MVPAVPPLREPPEVSGVVVIGGGPAGSAAACALAAAGRRVTVLEREPGPAHKVCGDFLSAEAQRSLAALGIDLARLGAAPIGGLRLVGRRRVASAKLPFAGAGLTRRALDEALLARAQALGADVRRGEAVRSLSWEDGRAVVRTGAQELSPETVLLATGKHALRGAPGPASASGLVGLKMYFRLDRAQAAELDGHVEIIPFAGGYAGLNAVEDGAADLCLLVTSRRLAAEGGWDGLLRALKTERPHLAARLRHAEPLLEKPLAVGNLPYGHLHAPDERDPVFRLGDRAAMIGSFSGDGVSIALHSGRLAGATLLAGGAAADHHRALRRDLARQVRTAQVIHRAFARPALQPAIVAACRAAPALLRLGAALTRIPSRAEAALAVREARFVPAEACG